MFLKTFTLLAFLLTPLFSLWASFETGTITRLRGEAEIISAKEVSNATPVRYREEDLFLRSATIGESVQRGEIIRTLEASVARIVFENGDQFTIGPGTEYFLETKGEENESVVNLLRGRLRGVVNPEREDKIEIQTRTVSMGVRGTDFTVHNPRYDQTNLNVIRGEVEVRSSQDVQKQTEPILVSTGLSAQVIEEDLLVRQSTQKELLEIQTNLTVERDESELEKVDSRTKQKVQRLERKANRTTLSDIRRYDPNLFESLRKRAEKGQSLNIDKEVFATAVKSAPEDEKLTPKQLRRLRQSPYEEFSP